jgi:hypothetical protein
VQVLWMLQILGSFFFNKKSWCVFYLTLEITKICQSNAPSTNKNMTFEKHAGLVARTEVEKSSGGAEDICSSFCSPCFLSDIPGVVHNKKK